MKWIMLGLVAIVVGIAAIAGTVGVEQGVLAGVKKNVGRTEDIKSIQDVLREDKVLSDVLAERIQGNKIEDTRSFDRTAGYFDDYVEQAQKIDTRLCPRDFAEAYYRHITARADLANVWRAHPAIPSGDEAFLEGLVKGMQGDATGGMGDLRNEFDAWLKEVKAKDEGAHKSWQEVIATAVRYGA